MSQQLNLYDLALKPKREWLKLEYVLAAAVLVLLLLGGLATWGYQREAAELAQLQRHETQLKSTQAQLVELAAMQAQRRPDPALEQEIAARRQFLKQKQEVLALLESGEVGQVQGFSPVMAALARQVPEGLWLQGFDLQSGGRSMLLEGGLMSEPLLPRLVQNLNQEPLFAGRHFAALQMSPVAPLPAPAVSGQGVDAAAVVDERSFLERNGYLRFSLEGVGLEKVAGEAR